MVNLLLCGFRLYENKKKNTEMLAFLEKPHVQPPLLGSACDLSSNPGGESGYDVAFKGVAPGWKWGAGFQYSEGLFYSDPVCELNLFSRLQLFTILWTVTRQAPLSMGLSRQEYGSG